MIRNMAKARSSKTGEPEGLDLFAFAAVRKDAPNVVEVALDLPASAVADLAEVARTLLAGLDRLEDGDLLRLVSALGAEGDRRGLMPSRSPDEGSPKPGSRLKPSPAMAASGLSALPTSKVNAIRAALEAGVKPPAVARQFGVSIGQIKKLFDAS